MVDVVTQLSFRGGAVLLLTVALELVTVRGSRLLLCIAVMVAMVVFSACHVPGFSPPGVIATIAAATIGVSVLSMLFVRAPIDFVIAGSLVIQSLVWLWMIDNGTKFTNGELGFDSPPYFAAWRTGWVAAVSVVALVTCSVIVRECFWRSRYGRAAQFLDEDRVLAISLGLDETRTSIVSCSLVAVCIALASVAWFVTYPRLQAGAFSLDLALIPVLGLMVAGRGGHPRLLYVFVIGYVTIAVLVRTLAGGLGPVLERLLLGGALLTMSLLRSKR